MQKVFYLARCTCFQVHTSNSIYISRTYLQTPCTMSQTFKGVSEKTKCSTNECQSIGNTRVLHGSNTAGSFHPPARLSRAHAQEQCSGHCSACDGNALGS